jgi:hypothetical protein
MNAWKNVYRDAVAAATDNLGSQKSEARDFLKDAAAAHKRSLESVLAAFADGKIDETTLRSELADQKRMLRAELLAAEPITTKGAQGAANAFFAVIDEAADASVGGRR